MAVSRMPVDPDAGIPDLVRRLSDDSKRLLRDEARLAKLEVTENVRRAGKGTMLLAVAFGVGVVAAVMVTLLSVTLIGRVVGGHMWVGALVTGIAEVIVGVMLVKKGMHAFAEPSYSLEQTRDSLVGH